MREKLPCPYCGGLISKVVKCHRFTNRAGIFRRRKCQGCAKNFTTEELVKPVYPSGATGRYLPPHI